MLYRRDGGGVRSSRKVSLLLLLPLLLPSSSSSSLIAVPIHYIVHTYILHIIIIYVCVYCVYRIHDEDTAADGTRDILTTADNARGLNICPSTTHTRTHAYTRALDYIAHTLYGPLNNRVTL